MIRSTASGKPRLDAIDNLRGVAALLVLLSHTWLFTTRYNYSFGPLAISNWLTYGFFAIHLFIILSGFVLAYPLVSDDGWKQLDVWDFYKRRALRIVPPYYAVIILLVVASFVVPALYNALGAAHQTSLPRPTMLELGSHLLFSRNLVAFFAPVGSINGVFWSIEVEIAYYLLFPLLMLATRRFGVLNMVVGALLLTVLWRVIIFQNLVDTRRELLFQLFRVFPARLFEFALGILAAMVVYRYRTQIRGFAMLVAGVVFFWFGTMINVGMKGAQFNPMIDIILGVSGFCFVLAICGSEVIRRIFSSRPLIWVGGFSYSIYLVHQPILQELYTWFPDRQGLDAFLTYTVGFTLFAVACAYIFYRLIERPTILLGRRLTRRQQQHTPASPNVEQPATAAASEQRAAP